MSYPHERTLRLESHQLRILVRQLEKERDAALNMLEGYDSVLTRRLRDEFAFSRGLTITVEQE